MVYIVRVDHLSAGPSTLLGRVVLFLFLPVLTVLVGPRSVDSLCKQLWVSLKVPTLFKTDFKMDKSIAISNSNFLTITILSLYYSICEKVKIEFIMAV